MTAFSSTAFSSARNHKIRQHLLACFVCSITLIPAYQNAKADSMSTEAYLEKWRQAMLLSNQDHFAAARPLLLELSQSSRAGKEVFSKLADTYSADIQSSDKDLNLAEAALNRALAIDPEWGVAWRQKCGLAVQKEEYKKAVSFGDKALSCKEPDASVYYQRAKAYAALKEYKQALIDDETYIKAHPAKVTARNTLPGELALKASLLEELGRFDEAIIVYRELEKHNFDGANLNIVRCLSRENKLPEAIKEISLLVKKNPKDDMAFYKRAELKRKANDLNGALSDYSNAINLSPLSRYYEERAKIYDALHKPEEAKADRKNAKNDF